MASSLTRRAAIGAGAAWLAGCGGGAYRSGRRPPPGRVVIFPAHITLGERRLGGRFHLRRDWSEALRTPVLDAAVAGRGRVPVLLTAADDAQTAWALARLHRPVAESLMGFDAGLTGGDPVPTRGRPGLGEGGSAIARRHDAPTGLFISVSGDYAEGWQRAGEIVLREALALEVVGVERRLIVSLVELETGLIYWSGARRDRNLRNPVRAERHVRALITKAGFRRQGAA